MSPLRFDLLIIASIALEPSSRPFACSCLPSRGTMMSICTTASVSRVT